MHTSLSRHIFSPWMSGAVLWFIESRLYKQSRPLREKRTVTLQKTETVFKILHVIWNKQTRVKKRWSWLWREISINRSSAHNESKHTIPAALVDWSGRDASLSAKRLKKKINDVRTCEIWKTYKATNRFLTEHDVGLQELMKTSVPHVSVQEVVTGQQETQRLPLMTVHLSNERKHNDKHYISLT